MDGSPPPVPADGRSSERECRERSRPRFQALARPILQPPEHGSALVASHHLDRNLHRADRLLVRPPRLERPELEPEEVGIPEHALQSLGIESFQSIAGLVETAGLNGPIFGKGAPRLVGVTWVIGYACPLTALLLADVRITVDEPTGYRPITEFGVQKAHVIAPNLIAGFAGSIALGFEMVRSLQDFYTPDRFGRMVDTGTLSDAWRRHVNESYRASVPDELAGRECHLIICGLYATGPRDQGGMMSLRPSSD
jgi:hypothetical protein